MSSLKISNFKPVSAEREREHAEREERRKRDADSRKREYLLAESGLPQRHRAIDEYALKDSECGGWSEAHRKAERSVMEKGSVLLVGKRGPGKTQIATCIGLCRIASLFPVRYCTAADFFTECREAMHDNCESKAIKRFVGYDLLIIDEAHVRGQSDYEDRLLTRVMDARYRAVKSTIVITNETRQQAAKTLGASVVSRLHEDGLVIECNWKSFRGHA